MPRAQAYQPWLWFCCRWTQSLSGTPSEAEIHDIDMNLSKARTVAFISLVFCDLWPQRGPAGTEELVRFRDLGRRTPSNVGNPTQQKPTIGMVYTVYTTHLW